MYRVVSFAIGLCFIIKTTAAKNGSGKK